MRKYMYIIFFLLIVSFVSAVTVTQTGYFGNFQQNVWNTSNSQENLTFIGGENQTLYLELPKQSNITYENININTEDNLNNFSVFLNTERIYSNNGGTPTNLLFSDDAETGSWNDSWFARQAVNGEYNTDQVHSGTYSIDSQGKVSSNATTTLTNVYFEGWFYDSGTAGAVNAIALGEWAGSDTYYAGLHDPAQATNYAYMPKDAAWHDSGIAQSVGWHNVSFYINTTQSKIWIDGILVNVSDAGVPSTLDITTNSNNIATSFFDDFKLCQGTECLYNPAEFNISKNITDVNDEINTYLLTCTADINNNCQVPFNFYSVSAGNLTVDIGNTINYSLMYNFSYNNDTIEKESSDYTLNVYNNHTISANFYKNNTLYTPTRTVYDGYTSFTLTNIGDWVPTSVINFTNPLYWQINITEFNSSDTTTTYNQTVHKIYLNDSSGCVYPTTLNFSIKNASDEALLSPAGLDIYFDLWYDNSAYSRNYTFSYTGNSSYNVCIYPSWANYTTNAQAQYSFGAFADKLYYLTNAVLNNVTQYINLYFEDGASQVQFTVVDLNDISLQDVTIQVMSYDVGSNTFTTTEILQTDDQGLAYGQLVLGNWYKFILTYNDVVVLETTPSIINSATRTFRVNLASNYLEDNYDVFGNMAHTLTFDNSTLTFDFTYAQSDGTPVSACLEVIKQNVMGNTVLTNTCPSSVASGTIFYTITENITGATYIANSYIQFGNNSNLLSLDTLSVTFDGQYKEWGLEGVFVTFLLLITVAMVGIWNPVVAVFLMLIGIIAAIVMNIFYLSWGAIVALIIIGIIAMYRMNK